MPNSGYRRRDAYIPLPQLGEGLVAAGMDPDKANALVLDALRSGQLLAEGCREHRFDDQPTRGPLGDREQIRRSWWRGFKADEFGRTGGFSTANHAVGYHIEAPSPELLDAMVKAGITDRVNDPLTGARYRRTWTAYHAIRVESEVAYQLIEARKPASAATSQRRPAGREPRVSVHGLVEYMQAVERELPGCHGQLATACEIVAHRAICEGSVTIDDRAATATADDLLRVKEHLRSKCRRRPNPRA